MSIQKVIRVNMFWPITEKYTLTNIWPCGEFMQGFFKDGFYHLQNVTYFTQLVLVWQTLEHSKTLYNCDYSVWLIFREIN